MFVCKTLYLSTSFDGINKITWKCVCNLGEIKDAHTISDRTELFIRTVAQYRCITQCILLKHRKT